MGLNKRTVKKFDNEVHKLKKSCAKLRQMNLALSTAQIQRIKDCEHDMVYREIPYHPTDEMIGINLCTACKADEHRIMQIDIEGWEEELKQWPSLDSYFGADTEAEMI